MKIYQIFVIELDDGTWSASGIHSDVADLVQAGRNEAAGQYLNAILDEVALVDSVYDGKLS